MFSSLANRFNRTNYNDISHEVSQHGCAISGKEKRYTLSHILEELRQELGNVNTYQDFNDRVNKVLPKMQSENVEINEIDCRRGEISVSDDNANVASKENKPYVESDKIIEGVDYLINYVNREIVSLYENINISPKEEKSLKFLRRRLVYFIKLKGKIEKDIKFDKIMVDLYFFINEISNNILYLNKKENRSPEEEKDLERLKQQLAQFCRDKEKIEQERGSVSHTEPYSMNNP